jgi:hypothetical protein
MKKKCPSLSQQKRPNTLSKMVHPIVAQYIATHSPYKQERFKSIIDALEKGMQAEVLKPKNISKYRTEIDSEETYNFPVFRLVNIKTGERKSLCGLMAHSAQISIYAPDCNGWPPLVGEWCDAARLSYGLSCIHIKDASTKELPVAVLGKIGAHAFKMVTDPKFKFIRDYCGHDLKKLKNDRAKKNAKKAVKASNTGAKKKKNAVARPATKRKAVVIKKGTKPKKVALKKKVKK